MITFESRFEDYYTALGNAEQVEIYNYFAGANLCPTIYDSSEIDEVFENFTPAQITKAVQRGDYQPYHDWFYINDKGYMQGIEIVPEWLEGYIPAMARYYEREKDVMLCIDANAEMLYKHDYDYVRDRFNEMTLGQCIVMWNESACDHYCRLQKMYSMDDLVAWNALARELGGWDLVHAVLQSDGNFNDLDKYFFYDVDCGHMRSFSTKQELIEQIGDDFFIEHLSNN